MQRFETKKLKLRQCLGFSPEELGHISPELLHSSRYAQTPHLPVADVSIMSSLPFVFLAFHGLTPGSGGGKWSQTGGWIDFCPLPILLGPDLLGKSIDLRTTSLRCSIRSFDTSNTSGRQHNVQICLESAGSIAAPLCFQVPLRRNPNAEDYY